MSIESRDNRILGRDMCNLIQHRLSMIQIEQCIHKKGFPFPHNETTITQSPSSIRLKIRICPRCNFMQPQFERDLVRVCHSVLSQASHETGTWGYLTARGWGSHDFRRFCPCRGSTRDLPRIRGRIGLCVGSTCASPSYLLPRMDWRLWRFFALLLFQ
jgi:hypothetical protein